MRTYIDIDLTAQKVNRRELQGEEIIYAGRHLIAKTLLAKGAAALDPFAPEAPLIFSAGPFSGMPFSNANRTSVGCKSPLTGGIKEANGGGTFSYALGQQQIAGFTLTGALPHLSVIHFKKDGTVSFDDGRDLAGKGNFDTADVLYERYGKKVALGVCGSVGEYQGLLGGISFSDSDGRPVRIAARGGVGAVMGSKNVKAIVVDLDKIPVFHEPKKMTANMREYAKMLQDNDMVQKFFRPLGTMGMADVMNVAGGLPVNNFSLGQQSDSETFKMGGAYISDLNTSRGGKQTHACMPGCVIQCSNVYMDADGNEVVSPVEYETLGLLGTNCGLTDPDDLAAVNYLANDLGIDTIEVGAMIAVLMEAGLAEFGDKDFMVTVFKEMHEGTEQGKIWAQGTARVGEHYGVKRVPVIKKQAISAYDPRVIEATGITMMATAQGADHTAGNAPRLQTRTMSTDDILDASINAQIGCAANDSLGLCIFGGSVTNAQLEFITQSLNDAHGTQLTPTFFRDLGKEVLRLEKEFNTEAGFGEADDELPEFFYSEPVKPTEHMARFHGRDVQELYTSVLARV